MCSEGGRAESTRGVVFVFFRRFSTIARTPPQKKNTHTHTPKSQTTNHTGGEASSSRLSGSGQRGYKDGSAATAQFSEPRGLAADVAANVAYVCDSGNNLIRTVDLRTGQVGTLRVGGG